MKHFDYIFAGAGLASLMTVYRMVVNRKFSNKSVLLLDGDAKKNNDRTWCFWKDDGSMWDNIVYREWATAIFADSKGSFDLDFEAYRYKMIRGIDFYNFIFEELQKHENVQFIQQKVTGYAEEGSLVTVDTDTEKFTCNKLFDSIYNPSEAANQNKYPVLRQHFIGWHIKTDRTAFDPLKPVFMDFSVPQKGNTRFMYVLPFAADEALVEYTLFSRDLLPEAEYEEAIKDYLGNMGIKEYTIVGREKGSIPMTSYPFWNKNTRNIFHIGTAGGWTKASTGYTFRNADVLSQKLVEYLTNNNDLAQFHKTTRFWYYDLLLLDILDRSNEKGAAIFSALFRGGKASTVFAFLDETTTLRQDLDVILRCPKRPFAAAAMRNIHLFLKY